MLRFKTTCDERTCRQQEKEVVDLERRVELGEGRAEHVEIRVGRLAGDGRRREVGRPAGRHRADARPIAALAQLRARNI